MKKNERSAINPFTGKKHFDIINDDEFLNKSYEQYYKIINQSNLLDETPSAHLIFNVATNLINAVENYLLKIGRTDYTENYYDWEFHLVSNNVANAFCMPGGKIVIYSGILSIANTEEKIAFILGHEMAHALLDHSRTQASTYQAKNTLTNATRFGGLALGLIGLGELGNIAMATANIADIGSEFLLIKPYGRAQELEADKLGMMIIYLAGYNIENIPSFWQSMSNQNSNTHDFFSTHPADEKRINAMNEVISEINNQRDFYSKPILTDSSTTKNDYFSQNQVKQHNDESNIVNKSSSNNNLDSINPLIKKKFCQNCGNPEDIDALFCTHCGYKFEKLHICPNCGVNVEQEDVYCYNCGFKLL
jgi:predicted Zn-dependent protease